MSDTPGTDPVSNPTYPVLAIKNTVLFPALFLPLSAGRPASRAAIEAALATEDKTLVIVAQRDVEVESPVFDDLFAVGTVAVIKKMARFGRRGRNPRARHRPRSPAFRGSNRALPARTVQPLPPPMGGGDQVEALQRAALDSARKVIELARPQADLDVSQLLAQTDNPVQLAYLLASMLGLDVIKEQALLEAESSEVALQLILDHLMHESRVLELRNQIASKAQAEISKEQRDYWLRQQLRAIQDELGEDPAGEGGDWRVAPADGGGRTSRPRAQGSRARVEPPRTSPIGRARLSTDADLP